ncbi:MAG: ComEC/Rec2 family competence protein [bacterium]|nr:ComEC/Rec2 family competence protein [bacterium]
MNFSKAKLFLISCLVFILSIFLASFLPSWLFDHNIFYFSSSLVCLLVIILFWQSKIIRLIFLVLLIIFFALWRYGLSIPENSQDKVWHYNGRNLELIGVIVSEPDIRENNQKIEVAIKYSSSLKHAISGKILISTNLYPSYNYGDELAITCELKAPEKFDEFAYDRYLARYNIYSACYYPQIKVIKYNQGNWFYQKIFVLKSKLTYLIDQGLSEPEASLARPIVFGGQRGLDEKTRQQFAQTGLTHIMAVSGFNVSILAVVALVFLLGIGLDRRQAFYLSIIILFVYIILVGAPASAMRAGLMGFLVLLALHLGRLNKITNALVFTATILLLINPKLFRDDIGFQLSFLAIAGLVYVYPILDDIWQKFKLPRLKGISNAFLITLSAQIFTWPIIAYNFSQVSLIAPLANLLVVWLIPFLTIAILLAIVASFILPSLSSLFFLPAFFGSKYILFIVNLMSNISHSYLEAVYFNWVVLCVYYFIVIGFLVYFNKKKNNLFKN